MLRVAGVDRQSLINRVKHSTDSRRLDVPASAMLDRILILIAAPLAVLV